MESLKKNKKKVWRIGAEGENKKAVIGKI